MERTVKEDMTKKLNDFEMLVRKKKSNSYQDDVQLQHLDLSLNNLEREFGKTSAEMADIYCLVSGRLSKVREYLQFEKQKKEQSSS